jgi:hypothetical protein
VVACCARAGAMAAAVSIAPADSSIRFERPRRIPTDPD